MTDTVSATICVTCKQPLAAELKQEDGPKHVAQYSLLSRSDDTDNFVNEARILCRYITAVSIAARYAPELEDETTAELHGLVQDLAEEMQRRLDLASDAVAIVWARHNAAAKKSA